MTDPKKPASSTPTPESGGGRCPDGWRCKHGGCAKDHSTMRCLACGDAWPCSTYLGPAPLVTRRCHAPAASATPPRCQWCNDTGIREDHGGARCKVCPPVLPASATPTPASDERACVIGGFNCAISLPLHETVGKLRVRAVEEMHERKPAETWECRDAKGYWLEPGTQLGAVAHWPIYFNQPIGWGG